MCIQEVGFCVGLEGGLVLAGLEWVDLAVTFEVCTEVRVGV